MVAGQQVLDAEEPNSLMKVKRNRELSQRVLNLASVSDENGSSEKKIKAAQHIKSLAEQHGTPISNFTAYNLGELTEANKHTEKREQQGMPAPAEQNIDKKSIFLSVNDIKQYFRTNSDKHAVKRIYKGHDHEPQDYEHKGKIIASTLPVAGYSLGAKKLRKQNIAVDRDTAVLIKTAHKVNNWDRSLV
jgi:hypothetical protein